jgi:hypothetical protein
MKNSLWLVIFVVAAFLGFIVGYSVPPLVEVGMIGGKAEEVGLKSEMTKEMKDYYGDLYQEK